jgi:hypothetical protein
MSRFSLYALILLVAAGVAVAAGFEHQRFAKATPTDVAYDLPGIPPGGVRMLPPPPPDEASDEVFISRVELKQVD